MQVINNKKAILFGLLSFFLFSIADSINRFVLVNKLMDFAPYFTYVKIGTLLFTLFIGVYLYKKDFFYIKNKKVTVIRSIVRTLNMIGAVLSVKYLPLDIFYSIVFLMPLFSIIAGIIFLGEKFSTVKVFIVILGFIGIAIAIKPTISDNLQIIGVFVALATAILGTASGIIARKYLQNENPWGSTFYSFILAVIVGTFMSLGSLSTSSLAIPNFASFLLVASAAVAGAIAGVFYMKGYQTGQANYVAPTQYTQLFWGVTIGFLLLKESPEITTLVGCAIIIFANLLNLKDFKRKTKNEASLTQ